MFNRHPSYEIMYVASGTCLVNFLDDSSGEHKETYHLRKNQFVFIDSGTIHQLITDEKCLIYHIEFKLVPRLNHQYCIHDFFKANPQLQLFYNHNFRYVVSNDTQRVWKIIKTIHAETDEIRKSQHLLDENSYTSLLQFLFGDLLINIFKCAEANKTRQLTPSHYINSALLYIKEHFKDSELCVSEIADHIKINRTYFQKLFHEQTKKTVSQYINEIRINEAIFLIENTDKLIIDICFEVGYNTRQNFFRTFKKFMKIGPQEYRTKILNNEKEVYGKDHPSEVIK